MSIAERCWDLLGSWNGVEEQLASPWGPATSARAAMTFKLDLGGTAVIQDYRQVRESRDEFLAHGVLLSDEHDPDVVLWWLFDSVGHAPEPGRGRWTEQTLELTRSSPRATASHRFHLDGPDRLTYEIDVAPTGAEPGAFLRGRYQRVSGH